MITADNIVVDTDDGRFVLIIETEDGDRRTVDIHNIALEFYNNVESTIGTYSREAEHARRTMPQPVTVAVEDVYAAIDAGYALDDPKHSTYHDRMSEVWDSREGK